MQLTCWFMSWVFQTRVYADMQVPFPQIPGSVHATSYELYCCQYLAWYYLHSDKLWHRRHAKAYSCKCKARATFQGTAISSDLSNNIMGSPQLDAWKHPPEKNDKCVTQQMIQFKVAAQPKVCKRPKGVHQLTGAPWTLMAAQWES